MENNTIPAAENSQTPDQSPIHHSRRSKASHKLKVSCLLCWLQDHKVIKPKKAIPTEIYNPNIKRQSW